MPGDEPSNFGAILPAIGSAALFGASTPAAKALLASMDPLLAAGFFYLGSGLALTLWALGRRRFQGTTPIAPTSRADLGWLAAVVLTGGVAAPALFFTGLASTPASTTAILLNLEVVFTVLLARLVFREQLGRRLRYGILAIVCGCLLAGWQGPPEVGGSWQPLLAVVGACLAWAIDSNLTRNISSWDPVTIGATKGLAAGAIVLGLGTSAGAAAPSPVAVGAALLVGGLAYGPSILLFVRSLRELGAARTAAYFSVSPFVGALLSILLLGEKPTWALVAGAALVALGVWLHLTEEHAHEHRHPEGGEETTHTHRHFPDVNHRHPH